MIDFSQYQKFPKKQSSANAGLFLCLIPGGNMFIKTRESDLFSDYSDIAEALTYWVDCSVVENKNQDWQRRLAWSLISIIINQQDEIYH